MHNIQLEIPKNLQLITKLCKFVLLNLTLFLKARIAKKETCLRYNITLCAMSNLIIQKDFDKNILKFQIYSLLGAKYSVTKFGYFTEVRKIGLHNVFTVPYFDFFL